VQKGVTAAIRQLDKAKPAIATKPLHHRLDRRTRWLLLKTRRAVSRRRAVPAAATVIPSATAAVTATTAAAKIIVELAPPAPIAMPSPVFHDRNSNPEPGDNHPAIP
jgi:hypothetical protein